MRSTSLFETMIKFILFISVFSPISVAQDFSSYSGDSLQFSAGSSAHGLQTFLYKLPWLLRGLENVKDPTEVFENITNEQCTSHISYIINQLSEAIGNNGNPLELDNFIMQSTYGKIPVKCIQISNFLAKNVSFFFPQWWMHGESFPVDS